MEAEGTQGHIAFPEGEIQPRIDRVGCARGCSIGEWAAHVPVAAIVVIHIVILRRSWELNLVVIKQVVEEDALCSGGWLGEWRMSRSRSEFGDLRSGIEFYE